MNLEDESQVYTRAGGSCIPSIRVVEKLTYEEVTGKFKKQREELNMKAFETWFPTRWRPS